MNPVGVELDAAVLRILGWTHIGKWAEEDTHMVGCPPDFVIGLSVVDGVLVQSDEPIPDSIYEQYRIGAKGGSMAWCPKFSTDPNGHEALRLCGGWLDERCRWWAITTGETHIFGMGTTKANVHHSTGNAATRAEAICCLVLAIQELETTNPPRPT